MVIIMIKNNLLKTVMLGLCMATITTGSAYAALAESPEPSATEEASDQFKALSTLQGEVDKVLLKEKAKEIEKLGFMVNYTSVVDDGIEIGISPYSEDNANYIYKLVGKDGIKVVEFDQAVIYASGAAPDSAPSEVVDDAEVPVKGDDTEAVGMKEDKEIKMQIDATSAEVTKGEEKVYKTTGISTDMLRTPSAEEETTDKNTSAPIIAGSLIGGAALLGGAVLITKKKKVSR